MNLLTISLAISSLGALVCLWNAAVFRGRWEAKRGVFWRSVDFGMCLSFATVAVLQAHIVFRLWGRIESPTLTLVFLRFALLVCNTLVGYALHVVTEPITARSALQRKATG